MKNPLFLSTLTPESVNVGIAGHITAANTYSGGTFVLPGTAVEGHSAANVARAYWNVDSTGVLGTGNVYVAAGAGLGLSATTNLASGAQVHLAGSSLAPGFVSLTGATVDPTNMLSSDSSGILAVDNAAYATSLNMANIGNGMMWLGSVTGGTYGAASLGTNSDGNYHLGGGGSTGGNTLTITQSNVLTGAGNVIIGQVGGSTPATTNFFGVADGQGTVKLTAPQTGLTGAVTLNGGQTSNGGGTAVNSSVLELALQAGATQMLGSGTTNVNLNGASVQLDGSTGASGGTLSIGNLSLLGGNDAINPTGTIRGNLFTIGGANGIVRYNNATLSINSNNGLGIATAGTQIQVTNNISNTPLAGSLGMVTVNGSPAPWIMSNNGNGEGGGFMAYTSSGLVTSTYTVNGVVANVTGAAGFTMANTIATDMVQFQGIDVHNSMTGDHTIYAFHTFLLTNNRNPVIKSGGGAAITLSIASGGISVDEQNGNNSHVRQQYGGQRPQCHSSGPHGIPTEAVLWTAYSTVERTNLQFDNRDHVRA